MKSKKHEKQLQALIKVGANKGKVVTISEYEKGSSKWIIDWPNSGAIGYFKHNELLPIGDWHFSDEKTISHTAKPVKEFPNGDPFSLIEENNSRTNAPILIELVSGEITIAYPHKGYYDPQEKSVCYSASMLERLYILGDCFFDHPHPFVQHTYNTRFIDEKYVVAWEALPKKSFYLLKKSAK